MDSSAGQMMAIFHVGTTKLRSATPSSGNLFVLSCGWVGVTIDVDWLFVSLIILDPTLTNP